MIPKAYNTTPNSPSAGAHRGAALNPNLQRASYPGALAGSVGARSPGRESQVEQATSSSHGLTARAQSPEHGLSGWHAREDDHLRRSLPGSPKPLSPQSPQSSGRSSSTATDDGGISAQQQLLLLPPIPEVPSNWSVGSLTEKPSMQTGLSGSTHIATPEGSAAHAIGSSTSFGSKTPSKFLQSPVGQAVEVATGALAGGEEDDPAEDGDWLEGRGGGRALSFGADWGEEGGGENLDQQQRHHHQKGTPDPGIGTFQGTWPPQFMTGKSSNPVSRSQSPNQGFGISSGPNSRRGSPTMSQSGRSVGTPGVLSRPTSVQTQMQGMAFRDSFAGQSVIHMAPTVLTAGGDRGSLSRSKQRSVVGQRHSPSGEQHPLFVFKHVFKSHSPVPNTSLFLPNHTLYENGCATFPLLLN